MTVNRDSANATEAPVGAATFAAPAPSVSGAPSPFSFLDRPTGNVSRTSMGEVLVTANEKAKACIEKGLRIPAGYSVLLMPVDSGIHTNLRLSSLVVALRPLSTNITKLSYHTLLLEASGEPLPPRTVNLGPTQLTEDVYSEAVMDDVYAAAVADLVGNNNPGYECRPVSAEVVPRTFNWEDPSAVSAIMANAVAAALVDLGENIGTISEINMANNARDAELQATISYRNPERISAAGLPMRADLGVRLSAVSRERTDSSSVNNQRQSRDIANSAGFIDLLWAPAAPQQGYTPYAQPVATQKFAPRYVLTLMEASWNMTLGVQLLALISTMQMAENASWFSYFKPQPAMGQRTGEIDLRDIGAINIEGNMLKEPGEFGTKIDTKTSTFDDRQLGQLLSALVHPNLTIALDVPTCSSETWYNEVFTAAAAGNGSAMQAILRTADTLTNGNFSGFYQGQGNPVVPFEEIVLNGYYTDRSGAKRDVRDFDYLAIMNMAGEKDPEVGAAWSDTILRTGEPLIKRLEARKSIVRKLVGEVTYTGTSRRITIDAHFLEALAKGLAKAGVAMRTINPAAGSDFQSNRGVAGFVQNTGVSPQASGLFSSSFGAQQPMGVSRPYMGGGRSWG